MARKRKWSQEAVIAAIKERHEKGLRLNLRAVYKDDSGLTYAGAKYCGSWDAALAMAGFDPGEIKNPREDILPFGSWSHTMVIEEIRREANDGLSLLCRAARRRNSRLVAAAVRFFGSWEQAVEAAGMEPVVRAQKWSRDLVIQRLQRLHAQNADLSSTSAKAYDLPLYSAAGDFFGGWPEALEAAGLDAASAARCERWTKKRILSAIAAGRTDRNLKEAAAREFGSWAAARAEAGYPSGRQDWTLPNRVRSRREALHLTRTELGRRVGSASSAIKMLETGDWPDPRVSFALKLAQALNCRVEDLYGADPEKPASQNGAGAPVENPPD